MMEVKNKSLADSLKALRGIDAEIQGAAVVPLAQKISVHTLSVDASINASAEAIARLNKLAESLQDHWRGACQDAVAGNERIKSCLVEAESAFKSAVLIIERTTEICREESERAMRTFNEHKERIRRVVERCDAIERDINPNVEQKEE